MCNQGPLCFFNLGGRDGKGWGNDVLRRGLRFAPLTNAGSDEIRAGSSQGVNLEARAEMGKGLNVRV